MKLYFETDEKERKKNLFKKYRNEGLDREAFSIKKYATLSDKRNKKINKLFSFFKDYYKPLGTGEDEYIPGENFINRAAFWMATGSGKSLVLIKTIEVLDYLQKQKLIPQREFMLLLPREDLIKQFKKEVEDFNKGRERKIELINLKNYEFDKQGIDFGDRIKVYYYRSDLLRNERKENILDFKSYDNHGHWYVFLDEAHRGEKGDSLMQAYVSVLSRNGFLFNFSATFTDQIDYATTCYNFNLEKFILAGYGKNLYLSNSYFHFTQDKDDFSEREKQKQVLKSLIVFSIVKKSKKNALYHYPLMVTLVNSVQNKTKQKDIEKQKKEFSDLLMFFKKIEEIAQGNFDEDLFNETKNELMAEFKEHKKFVFGDEELHIDLSMIAGIKVNDIFEQVFNAKNHGKIEVLEGEKGKEIVLKLETTERPFALIKIGDAKKFLKDNLSENYNFIQTFDNKKYFENLNQEDDINLLLGSRSSYEGWDSNRPNVINMINIGKKDAKKFVLQAIGRGIRIEPYKGYRKRLAKNDPDKNQLLETLFVFATDKSSVKAIIETVEEQQNKEEVTISLYENIRPFDLLIPVYKEEKTRENIAKFNISRDSLKRFRNYIGAMDKTTLLIKTGMPPRFINYFWKKIHDDNFFQIKQENVFYNMELLLYRLISHINKKNKVVSHLKELEDEIIHFKHIKVMNLSEEEVKLLKTEIENVKNYEEISEEEIDRLFDEGKITREQYKQKIKDLGKNKAEVIFKDLVIKKIAEHYYIPVIYSKEEKVDYIKHIIKVESEVKFLKNLEEFVKQNPPDVQWMFSKLDESLDKFYIPYFYKKENIYRKFYPDFIFWLHKGDKYKIVFVDPKGTSVAEYQNKIDGFEKLFLDEEEKPKIFTYKSFNIVFDLKLIADDVNKVGEKYAKYWLGERDFSFFNL